MTNLRMILPSSRYVRHCRVRLAVLLSLGALALAGCASKPHSPRGSFDATLPPAMEGGGKFFSSRISAVVTLSGGPEGFGFGGRTGRGGRHRKEAPPSDDTEGDDHPAVRFAPLGSPLPAVVMKLRLTNTGKDDASVGILEFKSVLGNFAVRPATMTLAPGQSAETDPMISRLGFEGAELPVSLTLQLGEQRETQPIILRLSESKPVIHR